MAQDPGLIDQIDHIVLTVASIEATCAFYRRVLGIERHDAAGRPTALRFGRQKINLHEVDRTFEPKAPPSHTRRRGFLPRDA